MNSLDVSDMYSMIANYRHQFAKGFAFAEHITLPPNSTNLVVAGMGGSASSPDITLNFFKTDLQIPYLVHRDYGLPPNVTDTTLFVAISYSGNTEETISAVEQAYAKSARLVIVASGGKLEQYAKENQIPFVKLIPESADFQPRMASGYNIAVLTQILIAAQLIPVVRKTEILAAADNLSQFNLEPQGKTLAQQLKNHIPLIYTEESYWPVARVSKIKINENAKTPCFWLTIPEMNHTEMMGFTRTNGVSYFALMFQDPTGNPKTHQRMSILTQLFPKYGVKSTIIKMVGTNHYEKTFTTLALIDWVSYWMALDANIDPTPVQLVEDFKVLMK